MVYHALKLLFYKIQFRTETYFEKLYVFCIHDDELKIHVCILRKTYLTCKRYDAHCRLNGIYRVKLARSLYGNNCS